MFDRIGVENIDGDTAFYILYVSLEVEERKKAIFYFKTSLRHTQE